MIWRILGYIGATSFFVTGFTVLGDSSCISADIGGGRALIITCRSDDYGAFSGRGAGFISLAIGIGLVSFLNWSKIINYFGNKSVARFNSPTITAPRNNYGNPEMINKKPIDLTSIKTCSKCGRTVPMERSWCKDCSGTSFTHSQVPTYEVPQSSEEALADFFPAEKVKEPQVPEFKLCPMCAEEIKFAAKKCRYCQHMQDS